MSATLTPELLAKLRKLNQEATHRDWEKWHGLNVRNVEGDAICSCGMQRGTRNDGGNAENEANAALIAAMHNALPALLDAAEKLERVTTENAALAERIKKLETYAAHKKCCGWEINAHGSPVFVDRCTCGLDAVRKEARHG